MAKITHLSQLDLNKTYSYADYLTWQFNETVELIKGKIMLTSPAPNVLHQSISGNLHGICYQFFRHKKCRLFAAPFDVTLYDRKKSILANQDLHNYLCSRIYALFAILIYWINKAVTVLPIWIIEIVLRGNSKREMNIKYDLYAEAGVTEYWLVYPAQLAIHQFVLDDNGRYQLTHMYADGIATPALFPDLAIDLAEVFEGWNDE